MHVSGLCWKCAGEDRRADVKGGVVCLDRPSVCMHQGCVGSVLERIGGQM